MKFKRLATLAIIPLLLGTLASCGDPSTTATTEDDTTTEQTTKDDTSVVTTESFIDTPTEITIWTTMGQDKQPWLEQMITEFKEIEPNVTINHEVQSGNYEALKTLITNGLAGNNYPNMTYCYPDHVASYFSSKKVVNLTPYVENEQYGLTDEDLSDIYAGYWEEGKNYNGPESGAIYSLPFAKSSELMYYNADKLLNQTIPGVNDGRALTEAYFNNLTWDEFFDVFCPALVSFNETLPEGEKLFDYKDSKFGILGYDSAANLFITLLKQYDIPYTEAGTNVNTGEILWNNQQAKDLTKKFAEYAEKKYIVVPQAVDEDYTSNLFVAQNCLFTVSSTAGISHIAGQGVNIGCAVIPQANLSNKAVISQGPSFCVLDRGNENENLACWLFYKYITSSRNNITWSMGSGYFPIRDSSYNSREFQSYYHLDDLGYFTDKSALDYGQAITYSKSEEIGSYAYTSPVFRNSSASRNAVDGLMVQILTDGRNNGAEAVEYDTLFTEAYNNAING